MSVQIGFSYLPGNPLSWLIRKMTGAPCSHAWLLLDDSFFGEKVVLQASTEGFTIDSFDRFKSKNQVTDLVQPKVPLDDAIKASWAMLGESYDYLGLFGMSWVMLGRFFKRNWNNPLASRQSMFCSEAVIKVLQAAKYPGAESLVPDDDSPADLLKFLRQE